MTDRTPVRPPAPWTVPAVTLACFLLVLTLLAARVAAGEDPAIGDGPPAAVAAAPPQRAVQRIERTIVVTHVRRRPRTAARAPQDTSAGAPPAAPASGSGTAASPAPAPAPASSGAPAPSRAPASAPPPASAPAPAPAAPAPAPAPVTTRSS